ncbi:MAG: hypothetical protein B6244_06865 [Candidatus Cloacimonetes bacterium 4572_55]|nr:MAG: hypothetical protein B6244_06865 [Candidatus Cloacimonetes bacterium 4572_55]
MRISHFFMALIALALLPAICFSNTISGYLKDVSNGEPLIGGNVYISGTDLGAATNSRGYYVIPSIPDGDYTILFRYIGYETQKIDHTLQSDDNVILNVGLQPETLLGQEILVTADRLEDDRRINPSQMSLKTRQLVEIPQVIEPDLFRAVQALPGVSTLSDFSSGLYVRGGSADQNLILIDDIDVYNPTHLFGFFSTFNVDAVKTVELQKGGFSVLNGGRLSSIMNVFNKDGNRKKIEGVGRISLLNASMTLEGPWKKGSWMLSGRRSYIDQTGKLFNYTIPYYFYDLHGKLNYDISHNDNFSLSFYKGQDDLDLDAGTLDVNLAWGNDTFSSRWVHLFSSKLYSHFVFAGSRFKSSVNFKFQDEFEFYRRNKITDMSFKGRLTYTPSNTHIFDVGFEIKDLDFKFHSGWNSENADESNEDNLNFHYKGIYTGVYVQDNWNLSPLYQLQYGLRLNNYSDGEYFDLAPRASIKYMLTNQINAHATYGRYYQYLNVVSEDMASFADLWFPVDETVTPGKSDHYILGIKTDFNQKFDLEVEGYYKCYNNLVEVNEEVLNSIIDQETELSDIFNNGTGDAYGFEIYLKNHVHNLSGWVGYTLGWTKRDIDNYNFDMEFYPKYDRRHQLVVMQSYNPNKKWRFSASFRYGSGQPMTRATARYSVIEINGRERVTVLEGKKNTYRLPDYHRLDLGIFYTKKSSKFTIEPYIQVVNVYNQGNIFIRSYDASSNPIEYDDVTMLPVIPTVGVNLYF